MAKGFNQNKERQESIFSFGKQLGKRAAFKCEWCESKEDLKPFDLRPAEEPSLETLALLCARCRGLSDARRLDANSLRPLAGALWHEVPAVAEGAARILARLDEDWARNAIDDSGLDEALKKELLAK
ncbi:MAG TPA: hypothetical protein DD435_06815 [Cyanobacteria bacterium UBA8530]|nr:hypothetical protein [Cyanobacteria bacterium UBA8530]